MLRDLILANRSYRRFHQDAVTEPVLRQLVDLARLSGSAGNLQPIKYILSAAPATNAAIFPHLRWAAYLKGWDGPEEAERPTAYIVLLHDTRLSQGGATDHGIAAQSILLGAAEMGLGGCIIASINREGLRAALAIPGHFEIPLVIALGRPKEEVRLEEAPPEGNIKYWRDGEGVHHVPKRSLEEIIVKVKT